MSRGTDEQKISITSLLLCVGVGVILQVGVVQALSTWCSPSSTCPEPSRIVRMRLVTPRPPRLVMQEAKAIPAPSVSLPVVCQKHERDEPTSVIEPEKRPIAVAPQTPQTTQIPQAPSKSLDPLNGDLRHRVRASRLKTKPAVVLREASVKMPPAVHAKNTHQAVPPTNIEPAREPFDRRLTDLLARRRLEIAVQKDARRSRSANPSLLPTVQDATAKNAGAKAETEIRQWLGNVYRELDRRKVFPEEARRRGLTGAVKGSFQVTADGSIVRVEVCEEGHPVLQTSTRTVLSRLRLPPPPAAWNVENRVQYIIQYALRGK